MNSFLRVWLIALVVKTIVAIWLPFANDESYYWVWGHHPQLSYFDHPPMVGWLFSLGTLLEIFGNAARLPAVWLGHLTLLVWNRILAPYLDEKQRTHWLLFVIFSPFLGVGSIIVTPDIPLLFFWSLSLLILLTLLERPTPLLYLGLGTTLGLGFCSKYLIVLFVPIALLWLAWSGLWRKILWRWVPLTIIAGLAFCLPVIIWNWQNEWVSFAFQLNHGLKSQTWKPSWPLEYLGAQIGLLFPTVVVFALMRREPSPLRFLYFFGWLPLAFFFYTSFKARVEANWPIMAFPAVLTLAFVNMKNRRWLYGTMAVWILATLIAFTQVIHPWIPMDPKKLKTFELTKYDPVAEEIVNTRLKDVYLDSYQAASSVSYKLRRQFYKLPGINRRDLYDFLPQSYPTADHFTFINEWGQPLPDWLTEKGYKVDNHRVLANGFHVFEVSRSAQTSDH